MATSVQTGKAKQLTLLGFFAITASMVMAVYEYPTFATSGFSYTSQSRTPKSRTMQNEETYNQKERMTFFGFYLGIERMLVALYISVLLGILWILYSTNVVPA